MQANRFKVQRQLTVLQLLAAVCLIPTSSMVTSSQIEQAIRGLVPEVELKTQVPVIGVLTEVLRDYKRFIDTRHLHIAASYVKWIEMAGAQVVPVLLNQNDSYYENIFQQTNGLLLPGGDNLLDPNKRTPMMVAAKKLYKLAVDANDRGDFYPIWGTCLGLELLSVLTSNRNMLSPCSANDISLEMKFTDRGKMFSKSTYSSLDHLSQDYSKVMMDVMTTNNLTYNFHHKCLTDADLRKAQLEKFYRPLAYSADKNGLKFIAIMEAIDYPFFGVQFHPEKAPFEFVIKKSQVNIPHSRQAVAVSRFFADFFVTQAQSSGHKHNHSSHDRSLIYSIDPVYTALKNDMYEQRYLFPYEQRDDITSEEFLDYVPGEDEEISQ